MMKNVKFIVDDKNHELTIKVKLEADQGFEGNDENSEYISIATTEGYIELDEYAGVFVNLKVKGLY